MEMVKELFHLASEVVFSVTLLATFIVRLTPTKTDDEKLKKFVESLHKYAAFLPTFGVNPKTEELMKAVKENASKNL